MVKHKIIEEVLPDQPDIPFPTETKGGCFRKDVKIWTEQVTQIYLHLFRLINCLERGTVGQTVSRHFFPWCSLQEVGNVLTECLLHYSSRGMFKLQVFILCYVKPSFLVSHNRVTLREHSTEYRFLKTLETYKIDQPVERFKTNQNTFSSIQA